jgi:hypothetical protein
VTVKEIVDPVSPRRSKELGVAVKGIDARPTDVTNLPPESQLLQMHREESSATKTTNLILPPSEQRSEESGRVDLGLRNLGALTNAILAGQT